MITWNGALRDDDIVKLQTQLSIPTQISKLRKRYLHMTDCENSLYFLLCIQCILFIVTPPKEHVAMVLRVRTDVTSRQLVVMSPKTQ